MKRFFLARPTIWELAVTPHDWVFNCQEGFTHLIHNCISASDSLFLCDRPLQDFMSVPEFLYWRAPFWHACPMRKKPSWDLHSASNQARISHVLSNQAFDKCHTAIPPSHTAPTSRIKMGFLCGIISCLMFLMRKVNKSPKKRRKRKFFCWAQNHFWKDYSFIFSCYMTPLTALVPWGLLAFSLHSKALFVLLNW